MKYVRWSALISTLVVIGIVPVSQFDASTANSVTYHNPLAYIGIDGNIYVTDLNSGVGTAVTNDAQTACPGGSTPLPSNDNESPFLRFYRNIRWSPVGGAFTFGVESGLLCDPFVQPSIFLERSNSHSQYLVDWGDENYSYPIGVWSADGTQIAYLDPDGIGVISLADSMAHHMLDYKFK